MNSSSLVGTPRRDYMNDSSLLSTPRRDDSLRSLNNTLNRSDLSIYSAKSKVLTYETLRERALARYDILTTWRALSSRIILLFCVEV